MPDPKSAQALRDALALRFGEDLAVEDAAPGRDEWTRLATRKVHRRYLDKPVDPALLRTLCALALSAPSKSDLQQADILIVNDTGTRKAIAGLLPDQPWVGNAPAFLVFLANGRRLTEIFRFRDRPFPNDHLDQFFNAAVDAGIVLATFLRAADAAGLGACPISVIRDHSAKVSELLELPQRVIPVAGLCLGWPAEQGYVTPRLPLSCTVHVDRYNDGDLAAKIDGYDHRRDAIHGYRNQRDPARWGTATFYGWSEDKARQYGVPQRADFGAFVRSKGFRLD
jgi:nitroreductase